MSGFQVSTPRAEFAAEAKPGAGVLTIRGTLDYTTYRTATEFFDRAFTHLGPCLVVDLLELDFLDSRAAGLLVAWWKRAIGDGGWLSVVALERGTTRILWITGLASHISIFPTVEDAMADKAAEL